MQQSICEATTRTTLRWMGFNSGRVLLNSTANRKKEATIRKSSPKLDSWRLEKNVAWSDEIQMIVRIWCKQNENMDPSCFVTTVHAAGGGVMVWGMFSWQTLGPSVPIGHRSPNGQCTLSQSSNRFKLVSWKWQWLFCTKMAPTVTRSQPNRASLGYAGKGASCPGCASQKSPSTARCYPINMGQHF